MKPRLSPRARVEVCFDHIGYRDQEEAITLFETARKMRDSRWWKTVPRRDEPQPVSGEISVAR